MKKLIYLVLVAVTTITSCTKEESAQSPETNQTTTNSFGLTFKNLEGTFKNGTYLYEYTIYTKDSAYAWNKEDITKVYKSKYIISNDTMTFYITKPQGYMNIKYYNCKYSNDTLYGSVQPHVKTEIIGIKP